MKRNTFFAFLLFSLLVGDSLSLILKRTTKRRKKELGSLPEAENSWKRNRALREQNDPEKSSDCKYYSTQAGLLKFLIGCLVIVFAIFACLKFCDKRRSLKQKLGSVHPLKRRLFNRKFGQRLTELFKQKRKLGWFRKIDDFKKRSVKEKIFKLADFAAMRIEKRRYPRSLFEKSYGKVTRFLKQKAKEGVFRKKFGVVRMLNLGNEFSKKYYGFDLKNHKTTVMMGMAKALNHLPEIMNKMY